MDHYSVYSPSRSENSSLENAFKCAFISQDLCTNCYKIWHMHKAYVSSGTNIFNNPYKLNNQWTLNTFTLNILDIGKTIIQVNWTNKNLLLTDTLHYISTFLGNFILCPNGTALFELLEWRCFSQAFKPVYTTMYR